MAAAPAGVDQAELSDLAQDLVRRERPRGADRLLDDGHQLTLQRAVVTRGPRSKASYHVIGRVLDGQVDRHIRSIMDLL